MKRLAFGLLGIAACVGFLLCATRYGRNVVNVSQPSRGLSEQTSPLPTTRQSTSVPLANVERQVTAGASTPGALSLLELDGNLLTLALFHNDIDTEIASALAQGYWHREDNIARQWPRYQEVRDELLKDVTVSEYEESPQEAVRKAKELLHRFWQTGGRSSPEGWRLAYKARLLLERVAVRAPQDDAVLDLLVETIQSAEPIYWYATGNGTMELSQATITTLLDVRRDQCQRMKARLDQEPGSWENFTRAADLVCLLSMTGSPSDQAAALDEVQVMRQIVAYNNWNNCDALLAWLPSQIRAGTNVHFNIYMNKQEGDTETWDGDRRTPAFVGPRTVVPIKDVRGVTRFITRHTE